MNPQYGGLGGVMMAQSISPVGACPNMDCAINIQQPSSQGGLFGLIIDFFVSLFGGGGQPTFVPRGYRRVAHYPAMYFITDSEAQLEEYTPDLKQKSDAIQAKSGIILVQEDDKPEEDGDYEPLGEALGKLFWRWRLRDSLDRIARGETLPFRNDGTVFQNKEGRLPGESNGYYKEWVVPTPGMSGPGPARIVTGAGGEIYYTPDHYENFVRIDD